ncbi:hypothetical protein E2C01_007991 [Portunus trituberculatus]|uniref:Uncharacterized protein n=1 Tax=Portunus trituberculatus TaxID=210409 RepID=A0A5B7D1L2_PORTR|nr:hypothetical protein [Portunus trituberculatus]
MSSVSKLYDELDLCPSFLLTCRGAFDSVTWNWHVSKADDSNALLLTPTWRLCDPILKDE